MAGQTINVSILADTKKFSSAMRKLSDESGLSKLGTVTKRAGKAIAAGLAVAGAATAAFGVKAVKSASELEQSVGAVDAIFKQNAGQVHAWAKGAASDVGLARNEYNELASVLGAQLKNGGTALDELGGKTNELVGVGADLAAQFGGSTREAVEALSSALKGERDPIERYGVSLNQAKIDAEAAALGFEKVGGTLSTEATQAATLSLIMKQTSDAHGAFARESNTLAGQTQRLKANLENLSASAGTVLLPVLTRLVTWANDRVVPALERFGNGLRGVWDVLANGDFTGRLREAFGWEEDSAAVDFLFNLRDRGIELADTFTTRVVPALQDLAAVIRDDVAPMLRTFGEWIIEHKGEIATAAAAVAGFAAGFGAVLKIQAAIATIHAIRAAIVALNAAMLANPVALTVAAIAALVAGLVVFFTQTETGKAIWEQVWPRIQEVAQVFTDWFTGTALPALQAAWEGIQAAAAVVVEWFTTTAWPALQAAWQGIQDAAQVAADWYLTYVAPVFSAAGELIGVVADLIRSRFETAMTALQVAWDVIGGPVMFAIQNAVTILQGIWAIAWNAISTVVGAAFSIIRTVVESALVVLEGIIRTVTAVIQGDWSAAWSQIQAIVGTVWGAIQSVVSTAIGAVLDIITGTLSAIWDTWVSIWDNVSSKVAEIWESVKSTISGGVADAAAFVGELPGRILTALGDLSDLLVGAAGDVIDGFISGIGAGFDRVKGELGRLTSLLPSWKGPPSKDRTILQDAGRLIIDGFVKGMEGQYGNVRSSLAGLTQDVASTTFEPPTVTASASQGARGGSGGSGSGSGEGAVLELLRGGLRITSGRLALDGDGFATLIDGRIELAAEHLDYNRRVVGVGGY